MSWYYVKGILILAGCNLITVQGLSLLTGFTGLFSFGHAGFMAIGAYTTGLLTTHLGIPFYLAVLAGATLAGLISLILGYLTLNLKGDYFIIATLGFGESIRLLFNFIQRIGGARGFSVPYSSHETGLIEIIIVNAILLVLLVNLINSKHGRNFKAIREEEMAAGIIGINTFRYKMIVFFISAVLAGISGGFYTHFIRFLQPVLFSMLKSQELTVMVIFGGLGSTTGAVIGALVLTILPEILRSLAVWRYVIYGALVVFIMVVRPKGLMGGHEASDLFRWFKRKRDERKAEELGGL